MSGENHETVISFEDVRLGFDEGDVLRGISFAVEPGETKVLVGESGTGKTVALKLAAGLLRPTGGRVRVLGKDLGSMRETDLLAFRRQIGFVFQEGALFDSMNVADNVAYRLHEDHVEPEEIEERVRESLRFVEMEDAIEKFPAELSGGMRRRVSIARALVTKPPVVLYDSPTAGLDPVTAQTIITLILRLRDAHGVTSLLATHRLQDAFGLANYRFDAESERVMPLDSGTAQDGFLTRAASTARTRQPATNFLVLRDGGVYFEGHPADVLKSQDAYLKRFLMSGAQASGGNFPRRG